jgi:hypothetical protein
MACVVDGPTLSPQPQSRWLIGTFRGGPNSNPTPGMPFKIQVTLLLYHRSVTTWLTSSVLHPRTLIHSQAPTEVYAQSSNFWGCKNKVPGSNASVTGRKRSRTPLLSHPVLPVLLHSWIQISTHTQSIGIVTGQGVTSSSSSSSWMTW